MKKRSKRFLVNLYKEWRLLFSDYAYRVSFLVGLLVFLGSYVLTYYVSAYNDSNSYISVGDTILNRIPTYNLDFVFTWGIYMVVASAIVYVLFFRPEIVPFVLKTFGLLFIVRCGFIVLIHVGPPEGFYYAEKMEVGIKVLQGFMFKNDLFFSGHTAVPFMAFLLFKEGRFKWFMLFSSLVMGTTVLLMHVHYSIDVFAAFFITHGIYSLSHKLFNDLNIRFKEKLQMAQIPNIQETFNNFRERRKIIVQSKKREKDKVL